MAQRKTRSTTVEPKETVLSKIGETVTVGKLLQDIEKYVGLFQDSPVFVEDATKNADAPDEELQPLIDADLARQSFAVAIGLLADGSVMFYTNGTAHRFEQALNSQEDFHGFVPHDVPSMMNTQDVVVALSTIIADNPEAVNAPCFISWNRGEQVQPMTSVGITNLGIQQGATQGHLPPITFFSYRCSSRTDLVTPTKKVAEECHKALEAYEAEQDRIYAEKNAKREAKQLELLAREAERQVKAEQRKAEAEAKAQAKAQAEAKKEAERQAKAQAKAEAQAKKEAERQAKAQAKAEAQAKKEQAKEEYQPSAEELEREEAWRKRKEAKAKAKEAKTTTKTTKKVA